MRDQVVLSQQSVIDMDAAIAALPADEHPLATITMRLGARPRWHEIPENYARIQQERWRFTLTATADEMRQRWRDHVWETVELLRAGRELGMDDFTLQEASTMHQTPRDQSAQRIEWLEDELQPKLVANP